MNRTITDEAIVLKTYDIGEADRFCVLLTKYHGRIAARANGVRRTTSRRSGSLLALERSEIELKQRGNEYLITSATCIESTSDCSNDLVAFGCAQQAIELLLRLIREGEALPAVYDHTADFLRACSHSHAQSVLPVYILQLLSALGLLPSMTHSSVSHQPFTSADHIVYSTQSGGLVLAHEDRSGRLISRELLSFLQTSVQVELSSVEHLPEPLVAQAHLFIQWLLTAELGAGLKSVPLALFGSMPISYVN